MVDSQVRAALIKLGTDVRADFHSLLAGWQGDWLSPASVSQSHWLAADRLVAALGQVQEPFDSLLGLQRFLTAGFLPGADSPREEPAIAAGVDRAGAEAAPMAAARVADAAQSAPPAAVDQVARPVPARLDSWRSVPAAAVRSSPAAPQQSPTTGQAAAPLAGVAAPSPGRQAVVAAPLGTRQRSGLHEPAEQGSPGTAPLAEAAEADDSGGPSFWAASPRVGGLRDLAQRLSTDARPSAAWDEPTAAPTRDLWPALASNVPMPPVEEPATVVSGGGAVLPAEGATSLPAGSGREGTAAALSPVALPASTAPAAYAPHGQSGQAAAPAPNAAISPVYTTHPQVDDLMEALAREITREYHRYYGA